MIGRDGFACLGRVTLADCALVPALFYLQQVLPDKDLADPIAANANLAAYWAAIQRQEHAARILVELHRGREERRELVRSGEIEKIGRHPGRQGKQRSRPSHGHREMRPRPGFARRSPASGRSRRLAAS
jgi:hypothetical protein